MEKKRFVVIGLALALVLVLAACAPKQEMPAEVPQEEAMPAEESTPAEVVEATQAEETVMEEPAKEEMVEEPTEAVTSEMATTVDVEALIAEKVAGNHDLGRIFNADKTREEWETTLDRMIGYGAKINEEEKQMIIDYLLSR